MKTRLLIALLALSSFCFGQATGIVYSDFTSSGSIGTAAATIDQHTFISIYQTTPNIKLTIPNPTATNQGKNITINNAGTATLLFEPGGYIHPGKSIILRWSGIWQVSGTGEVSLYDSTGKVYAIDASGYGNYRYLTPSDLPDSIPIANVLGLNDELSEKLEAADVEGFIEASTVNTVFDSLRGAIKGKMDTSEASNFITQELDPAFVGSDASQITMPMINGWMTAYDWGNHAEAGYIKKDSADERYILRDSLVENDPVFSGHAAFGISPALIGSWTAKQDLIAVGSASQLLGGDGSLINPTKSLVGLGNVDNTSDLNKPVSTATQDAINAATIGKVAYSSYHALVSQSGTAAPTAERKDTCFSGTTFTWARTALGTYTLTASNPVFVSGKTAVIMSTEQAGLQKYVASVSSTTVIQVSTVVQSVISLVLSITGQDSLLNNTLVEIRVYN